MLVTSVIYVRRLIWDIVFLFLFGHVLIAEKSFCGIFPNVIDASL